MRSIIYIAILLLITGCQSPEGAGKEAGVGAAESTSGRADLEYAQKFSITEHEEFTQLEVYGPWQQAADISFEYILTNNTDLLPDSLRKHPVIQIPVESVILMSTTFVSFLDSLNQLESVEAVSGGRFIYNEYLRQQLEKGKVRDVGYDGGLNYELIAQLKPDVVFMFGVQSGVNQAVERLNQIGIPTVMVADYLEDHPLGRAEWIRFFGPFFGKTEEAGKQFRQISESYVSQRDSLLATLGKGTRETPSIMTGLPWRNNWFIPGGASFAARFIQDAGGAYFYADKQGSEASPVELERVFLRGMESDIWINSGDASSLDELLGYDERFGNLPPVKERRVFNNNARLNREGGNDYWESGVLRPDLVLQDLITIFHPSPEMDRSLYYYQQLQ